MRSAPRGKETGTPGHHGAILSPITGPVKRLVPRPLPGDPFGVLRGGVGRLRSRWTTSESASGSRNGAGTSATPCRGTASPSTARWPGAAPSRAGEGTLFERNVWLTAPGDARIRIGEGCFRSCAARRAQHARGRPHRGPRARCRRARLAPEGSLRQRPTVLCGPRGGGASVSASAGVPRVLLPPSGGRGCRASPLDPWRPTVDFDGLRDSSGRAGDRLRFWVSRRARPPTSPGRPATAPRSVGALTSRSALPRSTSGVSSTERVSPLSGAGSLVWPLSSPPQPLKTRTTTRTPTDCVRGPLQTRSAIWGGARWLRPQIVNPSFCRRGNSLRSQTVGVRRDRAVHCRLIEGEHGPTVAALPRGDDVGVIEKTVVASA